MNGEFSMKYRGLFSLQDVGREWIGHNSHLALGTLICFQSGSCGIYVLLRKRKV